MSVLWTKHLHSSDNYHIYVACADGVVRLFDVDTLQYVDSLPRPHYLGVDVAAGELCMLLCLYGRKSIPETLFDCITFRLYTLRNVYT